MSAAVVATGAFGGSSGGKITTIAGTGKIGFSGDGGPATRAKVQSPTAVVTDSKGNIYISADERVRKVSRGGRITTIAGSGKFGDVGGDDGPATIAGLWKLRGIAVDGKGNVYIGQDLPRTVRKVAPSGTITRFAGGGNAPAAGGWGDGGPATAAQLFGGVFGLAVDRQGNVYIGSSGWVRKVNSSGTISTFAGMPQNASAVDGCRGSFRGDGGPATRACVFQPEGLAADQKGNVYIADRTDHRVRKVSRAGTITTIAGTGKRGLSGDGGPATKAKLFYPTGVAVDARGNVYIADSFNNRVRKVNARGTITTFAGSGIVRAGDCTVQAFNGDGGLASRAKLGGPTGVAVDARGNVYIADTGNNRVRKVLP